MGKYVEALTVDLVEPPAVQDGVDPTTTTERGFVEVLADVMGVDRVSIDSNFFDDLGADSMMMARFCARVRKQADLPSVSMQDVYQHPTIRRLATAFAGAAPASIEADSGSTPIEKALADVLADIVGIDRVSIDANFFDDLGADSMMMARFCARVRKQTDLPSVSMQDIYRRQTIRSLAATFANAAETTDAAPAAVESQGTPSNEMPTPVGTAQYILCGTLQALVFIAYSYFAGFVIERSYEWISAGSGLIDIYLRSVGFGVVAFFALCTLPIAAKWVLIGRWKPQEIRVWSLAYVRFWTVKTLVRSNPLLLLIGGRSRTSTSSPLFNLYLRALGAKIGRGVAIFSRNVPVCTDLLTIGDGAVIRKDTYFNCYRAHSGVIQTGTVTLGKDVLVGEMTVLDIGTTMGDGAQLGHASSLHPGQAVPAGESWTGSPARRTGTDDVRAVAPVRCGTVRRAVYGVLQLVNVLFVYMPLAFGGLALLLLEVPRLNALMGADPVALTSWGFYRDAMIASTVALFGLILVGLVFVATVPRVLNLALEPDRVYRLYGFHYGVHRAIAHTTNIRFFTNLFGDSSYIVHYLRCLGYKLTPVVQTGANFGMEVKHENPYLTTVGTETMVADGLSIMNADFSSTSFRVSRTSIGPRNFLGNTIAYPAQSRAGGNCLLATKVNVPVDGDVREDVGLLGSPSFEIPRSVQRDSKFDHLKKGGELRRRLAAKNRYDIVSIGLALLVRWILIFISFVFGLAAADLYAWLGAAAIALSGVLGLVVGVSYLILVERALMGFRRLRPQYCSIYQPYFWWHERYWKLSTQPKLFDGTPFKSLIWRLLGVRLGARVFDDGCAIMEKTLVTVGDACTLNAGTRIQCHSQEDGAFKSDRITIGAGCTIGVGALVHYGATMGDGSVLAANAFLMKGEEMPPHARWAGNPARPIHAERDAALVGDG